MGRPIRIGDEIVCGALRARIEADLSLRDITVNRMPALDAVAFSVRDGAWNTAPTEVLLFEGDAADDGFRIDFRCRQAMAGVSIAWTGSYRGRAGVLTAELEGFAEIDQAVNRAGFSVLHPLELVGRRVTVLTDDGERHGRFPERIDPAVLFTGVRAMTCEIPAGSLRIGFAGEVFETEDHRNWSDAGWKTYCTPLALPAPRRHRAGERLRQSVRLEVVAGRAARATVLQPEVTVTLGGDSALHVPAIGSSASDLLEAPADALAEEAGLGLAFLDVEVTDEPGGVDRLDRAAGEAAALGVPLRVSVTTTAGGIEPWADRLARATRHLGAVSVYDAATNSSSTGLLEAMAEALSSRGREVPLGGGTRGYFAELNRLSDPLIPAAFLQLALSPEVHHQDDELVLDTIRAMPYVLRDAERLAGARDVRVGPVTLRQRLNVHRHPPDPVLPAERDGVDVDPRQHAPFAAVWLLGAVSGLAGAESISLFRTRGLRGLLPERAAATTPAPARLLRALAEVQGLPVRTLTVSEPRRVVGLAVRYDSEDTRLWLGNRTNAALTCSVRSSETAVVRLAPFEVAGIAFRPGGAATTVRML